MRETKQNGHESQADKVKQDHLGPSREEIMSGEAAHWRMLDVAFQDYLGFEYSLAFRAGLGGAGSLGGKGNLRLLRRKESIGSRRGI